QERSAELVGGERQGRVARRIPPAVLMPDPPVFRDRMVLLFVAKQPQTVANSRLFCNLLDTRLFRISGLGGNCSHVVDKYRSYAYPCLPVGLSWQEWRFWHRKLSYFTYLSY